ADHEQARTETVGGVAEADVDLQLRLGEADVDAVEEGEEVTDHDERHQPPGHLADQRGAGFRRHRGRGCRARAGPAFITGPRTSWPSIAGSVRASLMSPSRSMPVSRPMSSAMLTTSSVQMLPEAPGANGQPPRPPSEESKRRAPAACALRTFA